MAEAPPAGLLPPREQLLGAPAFLAETWRAARRHHGFVACAAALALLAVCLAPAFVALAILARIAPPTRNLASEGLRFLLTTFPESLLTRSHFTYEHLPPGQPAQGLDPGRAGRFVRALIDLTEDAEDSWVDEDRGAPLDTTRTPALLATTRRGGGAWDRLERTGGAEHIVAACQGRMFRVDVGPRGDRASAEAIGAALRSVVERAPDVAPGPGALTCWQRRRWWGVRGRLDPDCVRAVEGALLVVALDTEGELDPPSRRDRNPGNRWLDHAVQIVVSPWGAIEGLIDHAVVDGHDYGRLAERVRRREGEPDAGGGRASAEVTALAWPEDPAVERAEAEARAALWIEASRVRGAEVTLADLTAAWARARSISPDALCQLLLHRAFFLAMGRPAAGQACVVHRRRYAGGRYAFAPVGTAAGDAWTTTGQGLQDAADALVRRLSPAVSGPEASSTLFALAGLQSVGPMGLRAWARRLSDALVMRIPPLRTALYPELTTSNMSGLPALGQVGPVTQRPGGLASAHRIGPDGARFDLWWPGAPVERMEALVQGLHTAAKEAGR